MGTPLLRRSRGLIGLGLALLLAVDPVLATTAQADIWNDRRLASSQPSARFDLASLPAPALMSIGRQADRPAPVRVARPRSVSDAVAALPWSLGRVAHRQNKPTQKTVIHIQDVHLNDEAQKNIGAAVAALSPFAGAIALEAEWGDLRLDGFLAHARKDNLKKVADHLVQARLLDGPLHAALTGNLQVPVIGVDDAAHYEANVQAFRAATAMKAAAQAEHARRARDHEDEKSARFSSDLRTLDAVVTAYHAGRAPIGDYLRQMRAHVSSVPPAIDQFLSAVELEKSIDLALTERERRRLIEELARKLTPSSVQELLARSVAFRSGAIGTGEFYSFLRSLCERSGVPLSRYPAMTRYLRYVLAAEKVEPEVLLEATVAIERRAFAALARTAEEIRLVEASRRHRLAGKLIEFSLTPEEWRDYTSVEDPALTPFAAFYREAEARDDAMAGRLASLLAGDASTVILVTGGFHSPGLRRELGERGIGVTTWTPRITRVDLANGTKALEIFSQEKAPLEALFEGRKLFLAPRPSRGLARGAAALIALDRMNPLDGSAAADPLATFNGLLPGAGAVDVDVAEVSPNQTDVTIRTPGGEVVASVQAGPDGALRVTETAGPSSDRRTVSEFAAAMLPSTGELGRVLGLTPEETAVQIAPEHELPQTMLDYVLFLLVLPITILTFGYLRVDYFLELHDNATARQRRDRADGIASIRLWSTIGLLFAVIALVAVDSVAGGAISQLGAAGPIARIFVGALVIVPSVAYAQVRAHRRYNQWAVANRRASLTVGDRDADAAAIAAEESRRLERMINHFNGIEGYRAMLGGVLALPDGLRPGAFAAPAGGDIREAWWDQADAWWRPYVREMHNRMMPPGAGLNSDTARFQAALLGSRLDGLTVLEIGVGMGNTVLALSALGASTIHAIDSDPGAVARAQRNIATIATRSATFNIREDDATRLATVASESIDVATLFASAVYVLPGLRQRMARRIFDVMRPGGRLIMMEYPPRGSPVPDGEEMLWSDAEWVAVLQEAGFTVTSTTFENNGAFYYRIEAVRPLPPTSVPSAPSPERMGRATVLKLEEDQERLVAAMAHLNRHLDAGGVADVHMDEAVQILTGERSLPDDMWEAAAGYFSFLENPSYAAVNAQLMARTAATNPPSHERFFADSNPAAIAKALGRHDVLNIVLSAAVAAIDTREPRAVMPEALRADVPAVYMHTKGSFEVKDGIEKDRNEDFGLSHIFADGSILAFAGDGMGGYGHGDQAAQIIAAAYYRAVRRYWRENRGNEKALTDPLALGVMFQNARRDAKAMLDHFVHHTSAGGVFDVMFVHPRPGGWFFYNYHRGDTRTEIGEVGQPLRPASMDNDASGEAIPIEAMERRIEGATIFRLLRSVAAESDLLHESLRKAYRRRSVVMGGIVEGQPNESYFLATYGTLPDGAFAVQSTDGRLDPLTEAAAGRVIAESPSLREVPERLTRASQPEKKAGSSEPRLFRSKSDDALNQVIALGPIAAFPFGGVNEEQLLEDAAQAAEAALDQLRAFDREGAREGLRRAEIILSGLSEQERPRVVSTRALVRSLIQIVDNLDTYFVTGESLIQNDVPLGYVVDDGKISTGRVILVREESNSADGPRHRDEKTRIITMRRSDLAAALGRTIRREQPGSDYFEQRQRISSYRGQLQEARRVGVVIEDHENMASVKSAQIDRLYPNGSTIQYGSQHIFVLDNGATADALVPGMAILYYDHIDESGPMSHDTLLDILVESVTPLTDDDRARFEEGREKIARSFAAAGGLTLEAQQERFVGNIDGARWTELGLAPEELAAARDAAVAATAKRAADLTVGDIMTTPDGMFLVIDDGKGDSKLEAGQQVIYRIEGDEGYRWLLAVDAKFYDRTVIRGVERAEPDVVAAAEAAKAVITEMLSQPGKSLYGDIDELTWEEVFPNRPRPSISAMTTRGTRWLARVLFGWSGPADETKVRFLALITEVISSSIPVLHVFLHENENRGELVARWIKHGLILAATWGIPALIFGSVSVDAVLAGVIGNVVMHFLVSVLPWLFFVSTNRGAVVAGMPAPEIEIRERLIDQAFPAQRILGLGRFTTENLSLLGLSDAEAARVEERLRSGENVDAPIAPWQGLQTRIVSRLAGDRKTVSAVDADRLALAVQGGTPDRRRSDRRLVERLLRESPDKNIVLFINGSNAADADYFNALAARSGGRVRLVAHTAALIRDEAGGRTLDLASLEAVLAANAGAWEGAAFIIPADLAFDARGVGRDTILRRLVFLFLDQSLKALQAEVADLNHLDRFSRIIAQQA